MDSLRFTTTTSSDGVLDRDFTLGEVTGTLWSPGSPASGGEHAGLVLMGHGGGLHKRAPDLVARARRYVTGWGFAVAAVDAPGHGDRPRTSEDEQVRTALRAAMGAGDVAAVATISSEYGAALAERAVPEWRCVLDALQGLPEIGAAPVGYGGGITLGTAIGIPLTASEPRIRAAIFGGGFVVSEWLLDAARSVTVPVQFLLPWDDEHVDRASALALFDAFASTEKTLHANPGDHRRVRWVGLDEGFLARHLAPDPEPRPVDVRA